jgi:hypothetical protein
MSPSGQPRRLSDVGMSASPLTTDVSLRRSELTLRAIIGSRPASFDYLVGKLLELRWYIETECCGGL